MAEEGLALVATKVVATKLGDCGDEGGNRGNEGGGNGGNRGERWQ